MTLKTNSRVIGIYLVSALAITFPWFARGQIFLLDMVYGPQMQLSDYFTNGWPSHWPLVMLQYLLNQILPIGVVQAVLLTGVLSLIGWCGYLLAKRWFSPHWSLVVGLLLIFNPYVFERLAAGQWLVLLGFGLFPLLIKVTADLLESPTKKPVIAWILAMALYPMASLHWWYISLWLLIPVLVIAQLIRFFRVEKKSINYFYKRIYVCIVYIICTILFNSLWVLNIQNSSAIVEVSADQLSAFTAPGDSPWSTIIQAVSGYGFWQTDYLMPLTVWSRWWLGALLSLLMAIVGVIVWYKQDKPWSLSLAMAAMAGLAVVVTASYNSDLLIAVLKLIPGASGLRDTTKLIGVVTLFVTIASVWGARALARNLEPRIKHNEFRHIGKVLAVGLVSISALTIAPFMVNSLGGQVHSTHYPDDWVKVNTILNQRHGLVMALPWQAYVRHSLANDHLMANPVKVAIGQPVITSRLLNQIELDAEQSPLDKVVQKWLQQDELDIVTLKQNGVTYLLLQKESDYQRYVPALQQSGQAKVLYQGSSLLLYTIR